MPLSLEARRASRAGGTLAALALLGALAAAACDGAGSASPTPFKVELAAPEVPPLVLAARYGGPTAPAGVCIETTIDPVLAVPRAELTEALGILGVDVVASDCEASVRIEGTAARLRASYSGPGTCWTGWDVDGALTWVAGGVEAGRWPVRGHLTPPQWTSTCTHAGEPIRLDDKDWQLGSVLVALFEGAGFATSFGYGYPDTRVQPTRFREAVKRSDAFDPLVEPPDASRLSESELEIAVARIADALWKTTGSAQRDWLALRILWLAGEPCCGRASGALDPLVPYLIAAMAAEESADRTVAGHVQQVLDRVTGRSFDTAAGWWKWWKASH